MLTTREIASLILLLVALIALISWPATRNPLREGFGSIAQALHWKLVVSFLALLCWIAVCLRLGSLVTLWDLSLLKDSIIITLTFAIPMMFRIPKAETGGAIVRRLVLDALGLVALLEFYVNVEPLPLVGELLLQVVATALVVLNSMAATRREWASVRKVTGGLLSVIGVGLIFWTTAAIIWDRDALDWVGLLRSFLLGVWLPALLLPFFYVAAFLMVAETVFVRLRLFSSETRSPIRVRIAVFMGLRMSVKLASRFIGRYNQVATSRSFREASYFMRTFRREVHQQDEVERQRLATLEANTGLTGVDTKGAQLDRREFHETKERLRWVSVCEMGRYERNNHRYWSDADGLTDIIVDASKHGLPAEHGITVQTDSDAQRWRAWRVLPSVMGARYWWCRVEERVGLRRPHCSRILAGGRRPALGRHHDGARTSARLAAIGRSGSERCADDLTIVRLGASLGRFWM